MATLIKRGDKYFVQIRRKGMATTCRSFHYKADAEEWARHMEAKADRGDLPTPAREQARYTVRDILERYRDEVIPEKRGAEVETYIINAFLRQPLNNLTLAQITPAHFTAYREKRLKDVAPVTINRELGVIRHAFDTAMREWDMPIRENPLGKLRKLKVNNARTRRLEPGEWEALEAAADTCRNPLFMPIILLALETAMRRSEMLAIEWRHINFDQRTLYIPVTKNGHSRTIPLTSKAIEILQDIMRRRHNCLTVFDLTAAAVDIERSGHVFGDDVRIHISVVTQDIGKGEHPERSNQVAATAQKGVASSLLKAVGWVALAALSGTAPIVALTGFMNAGLDFLLNHIADLKVIVAATGGEWSLYERILEIVTRIKSHLGL